MPMINKKVAISDAQEVMVSQYTARQDCIEIAPSGLAMTTTEPNDELWNLKCVLGLAKPSTSLHVY